MFYPAIYISSPEDFWALTLLSYCRSSLVSYKSRRLDAMLIQNRHNHHMHRFLFASDATAMCAYSADGICLPLTQFAEAEQMHLIRCLNLRYMVIKNGTTKKNKAISLTTISSSLAAMPSAVQAIEAHNLSFQAFVAVH